MELKLLTKAELTDLYSSELVVDFPREELKPLKGMLSLMDTGSYHPLLATEDGQAVGYAIMWLSPCGSGALLEYFGVLRGRRNCGLGSRILHLLADRYGQLFCEAETPTSLCEEENTLRRRRIGFYERNGFRVLDYECALFGVRFKCLYRGPETDDRAVERIHRSVYAAWFSGNRLECHVQIPLRPGEKIHPAPQWVEEDG